MKYERQQRWRKQKKRFEVMFNIDEFFLISQRAEKEELSVSSFIRKRTTATTEELFKEFLKKAPLNFLRKIRIWVERRIGELEKEHDI